MGTKLDELLDTNELTNMILEGRIRSSVHETLPYIIYTYSDRAQILGEWTNSERICRGLIVNYWTHEVIARPFGKFFNYGDREAPSHFNELDNPFVYAFDKLDGSLGIGYPDEFGRLAIATRGSFHSEQAEFATTLVHERYLNYELRDDFTPLFEIIYPFVNVLNYGETRDLFYLGDVHKQTGRSTWEPGSWQGPSADVLKSGRFLEALSIEDRENAEGMVLWNPSRDERVKVKQEDYLIKHRAVWSLTPRRIWEALANGDFSIDDLIEALPDDYRREWAINEVDRQQREFLSVRECALRHAKEAEKYLTRKDQARYLCDHAETGIRAIAFLLIDGKSPDSAIWKQVKP